MDDEFRKQKNTIYQLYAVFVFVIAGSFVPSMTVQFLSLVLFLVLVIAVPVYKMAAPKGSFLEDHMRYLNGTIWLGSLFLTIGIVIMGWWLYRESDQSAFTALFDQAGQGMMPDEQSFHASIAQYMRDNAGLLLKTGVICLGPPMLYITVRILRALGRAKDGYRIGSIY